MPTPFKPTYHRDIPGDAKIIKKRGKRFARFKIRSGVVEGEVLPCGNRCKLETPLYYARIRFPDGRSRRIPLEVADFVAAQQLAIKKQLEADRGKAGLLDPFEKHKQVPLIGSPRKLPKRKHVRNRWGVILEYARQKSHVDLQKAIAGSHLADYETHLRSKQRSEDYIGQQIRTIRKTCIECNFRTTEDFSVTQLEQYLLGLLDNGKSYRTRNYPLKAMKALSNWMVIGKRLEENLFANIEALNEDADPNARQRRPLTPKEFGKLIQTTEKQPSVESITGPDRAMLYVLAVWTGYRRKELASLTMANISLDTDPPFISLNANQTKSRRNDGPIPLHAFVVDRLRSWLASQKLKDGPLFRLYTRAGYLRRTCRMMRSDCEAAGIPYVGDLGVADFHSHRMAFITNLCRTADFSTVVAMARHSDPKLTAKTYDRVRMEGRMAAINGMPTPLMGSALEGEK